MICGFPFWTINDAKVSALILLRAACSATIAIRWSRSGEGEPCESRISRGRTCAAWALAALVQASINQRSSGPVAFVSSAPGPSLSPTDLLPVDTAWLGQSANLSNAANLSCESFESNARPLRIAWRVSALGSAAWMALRTTASLGCFKASSKGPPCHLPWALRTHIAWIAAGLSPISSTFGSVANAASALRVLASRLLFSVSSH